MLTARFYFYIALLFIVSTYSLYTIKKRNERYKLLAILVSVVLVSELMTRVCSYIWNTSMPVYHVLVPIQLFFYWRIFNVKLKSTILTIIFSAALGFSFVYSIFLQSVFAFPSLSVCFLSFVVILASLFDLKQMLSTSINVKLSRNSDIWFNFGNIFFYSLTFFVFGLMNIGIRIFPDWIYHFIFFANLILYVCYGLAIHFSGKELKIDTFNNTD